MSSANYKFNSIIAFFAKASGAVATLLTTMLLARMLSKADFASFQLAFAVVMLGSILGPLGMGNAILRFAGSFLGAGRPSAARSVTKRCVTMGSMGLMVVASLLVLLHGPIGNELSAWPEGWLAAALVSVWLV
ncbi:MAG: oligosaccharide flippase family protein, partial [Aeoliella sp.]